jgi:hypothetical protein
MSEQVSGTHAPREDDALRQDVRSELPAHRATRAGEWLEPEPPGANLGELLRALGLPVEHRPG